MDTQHYRSFAAIAGAAALALALGACSSGSPSGDVELSLVTIDGGDDNKALEDIIDAFEEANPGITVTPTYVPEDTYATKLQTSLIADAPDVASPYGWDTMFQFSPLDELVFEPNGIDPADYNATLGNSCSWEGVHYCFGSTVGNMVLFYNKAMFDAAGVAYPDSRSPMTFDVIAALAAQLTVVGATEEETVFGLVPGLPVAYLDPAVFLDESGRGVEATGPDFVGVYESIAQMVADGVAPSEAQVDALGGGDGDPGLFLSGQAAMVITDNYMLDAAEVAGLEVGLAPTPVPSGYDAWVVSWTNAMGIPARAGNKEAAAQFLAFFATEGQEIQANYGLMPLKTSTAVEWATTPERQQLQEVASLARPGVFNPNQWAWNAPLMDAYWAALRGENVQALLDEAEPRAQQANDTTWELFDQSLAAVTGQ